MVKFTHSELASRLETSDLSSTYPSIILSGRHVHELRRDHMNRGSVDAPTLGAELPPAEGSSGRASGT